MIRKENYLEVPEREIPINIIQKMIFSYYRSCILIG